MRWVPWLALVACWSSHAGDPGRPGADRFKSEYPRVDGVREVAVGYGVNTAAGCVVGADGRVECWGGPNVLFYLSWRHGGPLPGPHVLDLFGRVRSIRLGNNRVQMCALGIDDHVRCLAQPTGKVTDVGIDHVAQLAVANEHACALTTGHSVWCWGDNIMGSVGVAPPQQPAYEATIYLPRTEVPAARGTVELALGYDGSCALRTDGRVLCWGTTPFTLHAVADQAERVTMVAPAIVGGLDNVKRVRFDSRLGCVMTRDDRISCVTNDFDGPSSRIAIDYDHALGAPTELAVGGDHVCALHPTGAVSCWTAPPQHRRPASHAMHRIDDLDDAIQLAMTGDHVCVATRGGHARCFGKNADGQLGDGTLTDRATPSALVRFHPKQVPAPGVGVLGCTTDLTQRTVCAARGDDCALQAPPGYWAFPSRGGALCGQECLASIEAELARRPAPPCECKCDSDPVPPDTSSQMIQPPPSARP